MQASEPIDNLAAAALENLVNQFARPLDFLRELVQNSIDAGSPRVEVRVERQADPSDPRSVVLTIHVEDWGGGMDERIIDSQLTRLFASSKEGDLTKIGKFGIGFTSIFAIRPEAVILRTGRHGEAWELFFHPDRSFEKVRLHDPVAGTRVSLFKRMPASEMRGFVSECRWVLGFWCEHSNTLIEFVDRTEGPSVAPAAEADPFAAFEGTTLPSPSAAHASDGPTLGGRVNRPLDLEADLQVRHEQEGVEVVVGLARRPRYGFYNGGLTLVQSEHDLVLGSYAPRARHLSFKIKYDRLEHTLTRDNVLQDRNWTQAMTALMAANQRLEEELLVATDRAVRAGESLSVWHRHLAAACRASAMHIRLPRGRSSALLRDHRGRPITLAELERAYGEHGAVLLVPASADLRRALEQADILLFEDDPDLRDLLDATWRIPFFALRASRRVILPAERIYLLPQAIEESTLNERERTLLGRVSRLLTGVLGERIEVSLSELAGGDEDTLILEGAENEQLFRKTGRRFRWLPPLFRARKVLIDRANPSYQSRLVLFGEQPRLATLALAHLVLDALEVERDRDWQEALAAVLAQEAAG